MIPLSRDPSGYQRTPSASISISISERSENFCAANFFGSGCGSLQLTPLLTDPYPAACNEIKLLRLANLKNRLTWLQVANSLQTQVTRG